MTRFAFGILFCTFVGGTPAQAESVPLQVGDPIQTAQAKLNVAGWSADPFAHAGTGEYMGTDRDLVQNGYWAVDYCSVGSVLCLHQFVKGKECLRVITRGEQIRFMQVQRWSNECRERGAGETSDPLPADVRYLLQWREECDNDKECIRAERFARSLEKKYAEDQGTRSVLTSKESASRK